MQLDFETAVRKHKGSNHPRKVDARVQAGVIFPTFTPKFSLDRATSTVFTLGSCFARNVEEALLPHGATLPTMSFSVPKSEWGARPNGLLNEYNPGTMSQRILYAVANKPFSEQTIVATDAGHADLLLHGGADVPLARAVERRAEIDRVYQALPRSSCLIVTLGFVEAWFDQKTGLYLNRMPPVPVARAEPGRFVLRRLTVAQCHELLEAAIAALSNMKIVITVSPVPIRRTFTSSDCVTANEYSKAALRVCADQLASHFSNVDYFPSYEIVRSGGLSSYFDGVHVEDEIVQRVVAYMSMNYRTETNGEGPGSGGRAAKPAGSSASPS